MVSVQDLDFYNDLLFIGTKHEEIQTAKNLITIENIMVYYDYLAGKQK